MRGVFARTSILGKLFVLLAQLEFGGLFVHTLQELVQGFVLRVQSHVP